MSIIDILPKIQGKYRKKANVGKMCWFQTDSIAAVLFIPKDIEDLEHFLSHKPKNTQIYIMGIGSNLLIRDGGINGVMIRLGAGFNYTKHDDQYCVTVGAACLDLNVANYAAANSIAGLEFFAGIPGSIGGALAMNAGAYGNDTAAVLIETKAINITNGTRETFQNKDIGYYYRGRHLGDEWIFYEAKLQGKKGDTSEVSRKIREIQTQRQLTQPIKSKTGGSTFKNPASHKAWQLIDQCGLRGAKQGGAKFSELHCNFLINEGGAKASDIEHLIRLAQKRVQETFGIELQSEIKIIGEKERLEE
ncbi:UDP-N-acetylmuramate dehydrogenase [Candidatus Bandiella euplotis]|uniref:UDP-N-acetylenolpyruvoylglucosamine reductase n=1 Tax=Candidatus Bandiella euplotis TaxID=1664265 RepID=A0ABZ0UQU0_9RICK|nr:UDP-N-acetylmuramate dehydrogenase [Candidatus Bandiella woodruffii]WPX97078.1 UDP-N-acetylenolpyruvoylglucosamine reductase [Candidatus Bandiella woodruffii]